MPDKGLDISEAENYGTVLQKLLPAEVTAAYLALRTLFNQAQEISPEKVELLGESRSRKSAQDDKWSFCLTAGTLCPTNQERQ
jgi:hypothetical protein